jgi:hypothetical protein
MQNKELIKATVEKILNNIGLSPVEFGVSDTEGYSPIINEGYRWDEFDYGNEINIFYVSYINNREGNQRIKEELEKHGLNVVYTLGLVFAGVSIIIN